MGNRALHFITLSCIDSLKKTVNPSQGSYIEISIDVSFSSIKFSSTSGDVGLHGIKTVLYCSPNIVVFLGLKISCSGSE